MGKRFLQVRAVVGSHPYPEECVVFGEETSVGRRGRWRGSNGRNRYPTVKVESGNWVAAHRLAWRLAFGQIPRYAVILHRCDNPKCFNPGHLELGTQKKNIRDMAARRGHYQSKKTHCPKDHPYDAVNTYFYRGRRICKACFAAYRKRRAISGGKP